jgi:hypothetical protein
VAVGVVDGVASVDFSGVGLSVVDFSVFDALLVAGVAEVLAVGAVDEAEVFFTGDAALEYFFFVGAGVGGVGDAGDVGAGSSSQKEKVPMPLSVGLCLLAAPGSALPVDELALA